MIIISKMFQRRVKPLIEFMESNPEEGCYYVDTQFGTLNVIKNIAGTIHTRIGAGGYFYVIEVEDEQDDIRTIPQP